jgi:hypothetical protein
MRFSAYLLHGVLHLFKDARVVAGGLNRHQQCDVEGPLRCQQEVHTQRFLGVPTGKNPEDSNLVSREATQWVLHYLSIGDDRRY